MTGTKLIIARHGNTFGPGETPTRVGARTNLPLVESGRAQAQKIGKYLNQNNMVPHIVYSGHLKRAAETAALALSEMQLHLNIHNMDMFNEIDYGPDENKPEAEVVARLGEQALKDWDEHGTVPNGWLVDPQEIIRNWQNFAAQCVAEHAGKTILVVTSNGIARFAPYLTGNFEAFRTQYNIKISTGALCVFEHAGSPNWACTGWNIKPG